MRELRSLDKEDIHEIAEMVKGVWSGNDHLPSLLPSWLSDPNSNPRVICEDGEICAVGNLHIIDQGRTGWLEGLRVRETSRGRGLGAEMTKVMVDIALEHCVERLRLVTAAQSEAPTKLARNVGLNPIERMKAVWRGPLRADWLQESSGFRQVSQQDFLDSASASPNLVPHYAVFKHYDVYDARYTEAQQIISTACTVGARDGNDVSLSLGFIRDTQWGVQWCSTIYAEDENSFIDAVSNQLQQALDAEALNLLLIHPEGFSEVRKHVRWLEQIDHEIDLLLFERTL